MPPHIKTVLVFLGIVAFIIGLMMYIHKLDNRTATSLPDDQK